MIFIDVRQSDAMIRVLLFQTRIKCQPMAKAPSKPTSNSTGRSNAGKKTAGQRKSPATRSAPQRKFAKQPFSFWRWFWRLTLIVVVGLAAYMVYLDAQVRAQFDGKKWNLPAKVYARPLVLYPGLELNKGQLLAELKWADYKQSADAAVPGTFTRRGDDWIIHRRAFPFWDGSQPSQHVRVAFEDQQVEHIRSMTGDDIALMRLEPQYIGGIFPAHNEDRELVTLDVVPPTLIAALIVTEDKAFFEHWGVSFRGIIRAMLANVRAGGFVQGGSTLTQQLIKNFFLTSERTLKRKAQEALMALLLELHYSKEEILQAYLNEVYLGQAGRRAIHGFGLAARFYFGKSVRELNLAEIAT